MDILKLSYDWDPVFRKVMFGTLFLSLFPADLYMRVSVTGSMGPAAWLLLPALLAYFLPFIIGARPHLKPVFIGLLVLNVVCMVIVFNEFFYEYLQPLVINAGSIGFLYAAVFQILFLFAAAYHIWVWVLLRSQYSIRLNSP